MRRLGVLVSIALAVGVVGTALAMRAPRASEQPLPVGQDEEDAPPSGEALRHAGDRLEAAGLDVSDDVLAELASQYGVGGAVRVVVWAAGDDAVMAEIRAMRDGDGSEGSAMGWGQIAKELGVHPGLGSIMGQAGEHARGKGAPEEDR